MLPIVVKKYLVNRHTRKTNTQFAHYRFTTKNRFFDTLAFVFGPWFSTCECWKMCMRCMCCIHPLLRSKTKNTFLPSGRGGVTEPVIRKRHRKSCVLQYGHMIRQKLSKLLTIVPENCTSAKSMYTLLNYAKHHFESGVTCTPALSYPQWQKSIFRAFQFVLEGEMPNSYFWSAAFACFSCKNQFQPTSVLDFFSLLLNILGCTADIQAQRVSQVKICAVNLQIFRLSHVICVCFATSQLKVGDPSSDVFMGSLVSQDHRKKIEYYVDLAKKEGMMFQDWMYSS